MLWRSLRCPRLLRAWLEGESYYSPKLASYDQLLSRWDEVLAKAISAQRSNRGLAPEGFLFPEPDEGSNPTLMTAEDAQILKLDRLHSLHQEDLLYRMAASCFPQLHRVEEGTLHVQEGESLRELGWMQSLAGAPHKQVQPDQEQGIARLSKLRGLARPVLSKDQVYIRPDFLFEAGPEGWILILVRSSLKIKDSYIAEAELTKAVLASLGISIASVWLMHPAEEYRREATGEGGLAPGEIELQRFFRFSPLNSPIKHMRQALSKHLVEFLQKALRGDSCSKPRTCPLCGLEQEALPEHSIYSLHRGGKALEMLEAEGIVRLLDVEKASMATRSELKERHYIQIASVRSGVSHIDRSGLFDYLCDLKGPLSFLDFESTCEVLSPLAGARVWEHLPFLFSLHVLDHTQGMHGAQLLKRLQQGGLVPQHRSYCINPTQGRAEGTLALAQALVSMVPPEGSVLVYGEAFELATLERLAQLIPEYAATLRSIRSRIVDVQKPFAQFLYYHPKQQGRMGLKKVLPLLSDTNHLGLSVTSGGEANLSFWFLEHAPKIAELYPEETALLKGFLDPQLRSEKLSALIQYCAMDTLGLCEIVQALALSIRS